MCWHRAMTSSHHQQQQQRSEARLGSAVCARSLMMMMMMMMSKKSAVCLMRCGDCCRVHVLPVSKRLTLKRPVMVRLFLTSIHWLHHASDVANQSRWTTLRCPLLGLLSAQLEDRASAFSARGLTCKPLFPAELANPPVVWLCLEARTKMVCGNLTRPHVQGRCHCGAVS